MFEDIMRGLKLTLGLCGLCSFELQAADPKLCFVTGSNALIHVSPDRGEYLLEGHHMAVDAFNAKRKNPVKITEYKTDGSDLTLLETVNRMVQDGCIGILGLYASREVLLVGPTLVEKKIVGLSASAAHEKIGDFYPWLLTSVPPAQAYAAAVATQLKNKSQPIYLIVQADDLYSRSLATLYKERLGPHTERIEFRPGETIPDSLRKGLLKNPGASLVFTSYPVPSSGLLQELNKAKLLSKNTTILGSPAWALDLSIFRRNPELIAQLGEVLLPEAWNRKSPESLQFRGDFRKKYGHEPENIASYAYDASSMALRCWEGPTTTSQAFWNCLTKLNYQGVTGKYIYAPQSSFPSKKVFIESLSSRLREQ